MSIRTHRPQFLELQQTDDEGKRKLLLILFCSMSGTMDRRAYAKQARRADVQAVLISATRTFCAGIACFENRHPEQLGNQADSCCSGMGIGEEWMLHRCTL